MKNTMKIAVLGCAVLALAACENNRGDTTRDFGLGGGDLGKLQAGIWVDPRGCDHWIIDDGVEGYLSARLDRNGKPVCSGVAPPGYAVGDFQGGADVGNPI